MAARKVPILGYAKVRKASSPLLRMIRKASSPPLLRMIRKASIPRLRKLRLQDAAVEFGTNSDETLWGDQSSVSRSLGSI